MAGKIIDVVDAGTIVLILLVTDDKRLIDVPFGHSCFGWLLQGEGCGAEDLIGSPRRFARDLVVGHGRPVAKRSTPQIQIVEGWKTFSAVISPL